MKLITGVRVKGFRSVEDANLRDLALFTVLVGRNNSGKSNLLRALNLFFANEPEPGLGLDFSVDHHTIPKRKERKEILVEVAFDISVFTPRQDVATQISDALGTRFVLQKKWNLSRQLEPVVEFKVRKQNDDDFSEVSDDVIRTFIALVNFRYIPNRTIPTETLASRRVEVTRAISKRVERTDTEAAQALVAKIKEAARAALLEVDNDMSAAMEGISDVQAGISEAIPDLVSLSNFRAQTPLGTSVGDHAWGSGAQAFLMFSVLHAIDRDRSGSFGWTQGTVWAVEEPESSLHHDLAVTLADRFHRWSDKEKDRLQIICTTHSEVFTMCGGSGYEVVLDEGHTQVQASPIPLLASHAARSGVTSWPQPLLAFPHNPVVFVEGWVDSRVLTHASKVTGVAANCVFLAPSQLDPNVSDGADSVATYLQRHGALWKKRPPESPLLVIFDWDKTPSSRAVKRARKAFGNEANDRVLVAAERNAHPDMSDQWKGIERFYTPAFVEAAERDGVVVAARDSDGRWLVQRNALLASKDALCKRLCASAAPDDFVHFRMILNDIEAHVSTLTAGYYQATMTATAE